MTTTRSQDDRSHALRIVSREGSFDTYLARPVARSRAAVVVLHEVFGVNADMRATCDELATAGFVAVCPELFWRQARGVDLSIRSQDDWETGLSLYHAFDVDAGVRDVEATVATARSLAGPDGRVGVMGFCLGGLLTFLAAARTRVDAAVAFHGARTEEFLTEVADLDAPLQMHLADEDEFIPKAAQRQISEALAGRPHVEIYGYPGCRHAFSRHDGMHYDPGAARLARERTVEFLRRHLA
ncbi:MAG TPA: dienelactone hydrolase family protein [Vicinamibacterales bacterium]